MGNETGKQKIRVRSVQELELLEFAYRTIFKTNPLQANILLFFSELSEFTFVPMGDEKKMAAWICENRDAIVELFAKRFKFLGENAISTDCVDPSVFLGTGSNSRH